MSIWRSLDGENWTRVYLSPELSPQFIAYGNGIYVAVEGFFSSSSKRVLVSDDGVKWTAHDGFSGYVIDGLMQIVDAKAGDAPQRFYRASAR